VELIDLGSRPGVRETSPQVQLRKIIKNRGHFPNDDAAIKLLWLAIRNIEDKRARERAKQKDTPRPNATPPDDSWKAPPSKAGKPPSAPWPCSTPTASTPTSTKNLTDQLTQTS
jgi:hypothetical protein